MDHLARQRPGSPTFRGAMLSAAVGMIDTVERAVAGGRQVRTSRGNAWEAVLPPHQGARPTLRDERHRVARSAHLTVGSSPRSRASQASVGAWSGRATPSRS